jgi:ElaB/YqjD/DUF883 family membrane-anchored ribosome-binding protein
MNEQIEGGAGPAVASHSKDASVEGPTPASSITGKSAPASGPSETVSGLAGQVRGAVGEAASSVSEATGAAREAVSRQTARAADQATEFVREQPLIALIATGAICFMLGMLLSRR